MNIDLNTIFASAFNTAISNAVEQALTNLVAPLAERLERLEQTAMQAQAPNTGLDQLVADFQELRGAVSTLLDVTATKAVEIPVLSEQGHDHLYALFRGQMEERVDAVVSSFIDDKVETMIEDKIEDKIDEAMTEHQNDEGYHGDDGSGSAVRYGSKLREEIRDVVRNMDFTVEVSY